MHPLVKEFRMDFGWFFQALLNVVALFVFVRFGVDALIARTENPRQAVQCAALSAAGLIVMSFLWTGKVLRWALGTSLDIILANSLPILVMAFLGLGILLITLDRRRQTQQEED